MIFYNFPISTVHEKNQNLNLNTYIFISSYQTILHGIGFYQDFYLLWVFIRTFLTFKIPKGSSVYIHHYSLSLLMWRAVTLPSAPRRLNIPLHQMLASVPWCNYTRRLGLAVLSWFGYKLRIILYSSLLHVPAICSSFETQGPHWFRHGR